MDFPIPPTTLHFTSPRKSLRQSIHHIFCFLFADVDAACLAFRRLSLMRLRCLFKHSLHVFLSSLKCARSDSIRLQVLHFLFGSSCGTSGTGVVGRSSKIAASSDGRPSSSSILKQTQMLTPRIRSAWMFRVRRALLYLWSSPCVSLHASPHERSKGWCEDSTSSPPPTL